jgi:nitrate/nitrite transporter NarK
LQRIWGFDQLIGPVLVKIVYYVGLAAIVLVLFATMLTAVLALFGGNLGAGVMQLIAVPAIGAVVLVYWRFMCELFMLAFLAYERLGEIRTLLGGASAPDPNHPEF